MSVTMYRTTDNGIEEIKVDALHAAGHIASGWSFEADGEQAIADDEFSEDELRMLAKDKGLDNWKKAPLEEITKQLGL